MGFFGNIASRLSSEKTKSVKESEHEKIRREARQMYEKQMYEKQKQTFETSKQGAKGENQETVTVRLTESAMHKLNARLNNNSRGVRGVIDYYSPENQKLSLNMSKRELERRLLDDYNSTEKPLFIINPCCGEAVAAIEYLKRNGYKKDTDFIIADSWADDSITMFSHSIKDARVQKNTVFKEDDSPLRDSTQVEWTRYDYDDDDWERECKGSYREYRFSRLDGDKVSDYKRIKVVDGFSYSVVANPLPVYCICMPEKGVLSSSDLFKFLDRETVIKKFRVLYCQQVILCMVFRNQIRYV